MVSCLCAGYLSLKVDFSTIVDAIHRVDLFFYLSSTLIAVFCNFFIAGKYYILIKESSLHHSLLSLVKINFITRFYALFLPPAVGREVIRWVKVTRNRQGRAFFLTSIIFERLSFLLVLILCGALPLFFYTSIPEIAALKWRLMPWIILGTSGIVALLLIFLSTPFRSIIKSAAERILAPVFKKFDIVSFLGDFFLENMRTSFYIYIFGLSLIWQILFFSRLFTLVKAASLPLNFIDIAWMGSLVLLLQTLPISFAGIGIREGAYAYLFTLYNLSPEKGVLMGILFFSQMLIMALAGGVLELTDR